MALDAHQLARFRQLAATSPGVDVEVYRRFDKNPLDPIIGLGEIDARIGFMGRDPGRDEICHGEPFIGAGGQIVRRAIHQQLYGQPLPDFEASRALSRHFFWINTVPYKPVGNKAWSMSIKKRFHPAMTELLEHSWLGRDLITLGREAFLWFGIAQDKSLRGRLDAFWAREDRFESSLEVQLAGMNRPLRLHPLPHPSPLNATWYGRFPGLLRQRFDQLGLSQDRLRLSQ